MMKVFLKIRNYGEKERVCSVEDYIGAVATGDLYELGCVEALDTRVDRLTDMLGRLCNHLILQHQIQPHNLVEIVEGRRHDRIVFAAKENLTLEQIKEAEGED